MADKIEIVRPSVVPTIDPVRQAVNTAGSTISPSKNSSVPGDAVQNFESVNSATTKLSEITSETLAKKQINLQQAVEQINSELTSLQSDIGFSVDFETNKNVVTVTRKDSGEVVRQIPSETVLNVAHNIEKLKGVLFDKLI